VGVYCLRYMVLLSGVVQSGAVQSGALYCWTRYVCYCFLLPVADIMWLPVNDVKLFHHLTTQFRSCSWFWSTQTWMVSTTVNHFGSGTGQCAASLHPAVGLYW